MIGRMVLRCRVSARTAAHGSKVSQQRAGVLLMPTEPLTIEYVEDDTDEWDGWIVPKGQESRRYRIIGGSPDAD